MTKIASVCMPSDPRDVQVNRDKMTEYIEKAAEQGVNLILFPELGLSGYGTVSMQQFNGEDRIYNLKIAEYIPDGESTAYFVELAKKHNMYICWGMVERDPDRYDVDYNAAVLVGPEGYIGKYRKVHQPLCERLMHYPGDGDYPVFETTIGKVGLQICFDKCYPEVARTLALKGAEIILNPTCWPNITGTLDDPDHLVYVTLSSARAIENMVFFVEANTSGMYMGGHSQIISPIPGKPLAATGFDEGMAVAEIDIHNDIIHARTISMGGSDLLKDRKPGTYGEITKDNPYNPIYGGVI